MPVIFFDIGDTLASPIISDQGKLERFDVFPDGLAALEDLKSRGYQMGIISHRGNIPAEEVDRALRDGRLYDYFNPKYIIYKKKDSPQAFADAAREAGLEPGECVFVGENSQERTFALAAGFARVVPHPSLVEEALKGNALIYVRITFSGKDAGKWAEVKRSIKLVPLKFSGGEEQSLYAITSLEALEVLDSRFKVEILGERDSPLRTDLYLVRDDRTAPAGFAEAQSFSTDYLLDEGKGELVVGKSDDGVLLAIPADKSIEEIHFPGAQHGHNEKLLPDLSLFNVLDTDDEELKKNRFLASGFAAPPEEDFQLSDAEKAELEKINAETIRRHHRHYAALAPIKDDRNVVSRHIRHADNGLVVDTLHDDLSRIGGANILVSKHRFQHEDLFLHNVIAEYPGAESNSLVLVTAHLDSTAASGGGTYNPATDPAPGADDDASGIAAVLAIAEAVGALYQQEKPKKTIRFVLFNAEEHGLIGSKAYARSQAAIRAPIDAVFQMDMIGYRGSQPDAARRFEVHAGFAPSKRIEKRSLVLADMLDKAYRIVSPGLASQQVYPDRESGDGTDPASGRSDHAPFQERGYAAVVISEDFFAGPKFDSPAAEPNPNYHKKTDREIDYEYAADIARAIAAAVLIAAKT